MEIVSPAGEDWELFLGLARAEGWRVPLQEVELYRRVLAESAFVLRHGEEVCGFVTAVCHGRSGWIGNLIVSGPYRRRGLGALLFDYAADVLRRRGARSLWLTASFQGRPLYERRGFRVLDTITRWVLQAEGGALFEGREGEWSVLLSGDYSVWGESRSLLLEALLPGGQIFSFGGTAALLQSGDRLQVLGPWISQELCPRENRKLIMAVLATAPSGREIVCDVPASSPVQALLHAAGFQPQGSCALMACGEIDEVNLTPLVSLASLGSMG